MTYFARHRGQINSYTYFAREVGTTSPIKIGLSGWPPSRIYDVGTKRGCEMELLAAVPGNWELSFHAMFVDWHEGGEWFTWSRELEDTITYIQLRVFDLDALPPGKRIQGCGRHFKTVIGKHAANAPQPAEVV